MGFKYKSLYIKNLYAKIRKNKSVEITERGGDSSPEDYLAKVKDQLPAQVVDFYDTCNGILLKWAAKNKDLGASGSMNLRPIENLFDATVVNLEGRTWRLNADYNQPKVALKGVFRPLDLFQGDAAVGFFSDASDRTEMYFHTFGNSFESLKVDLEGYFQLLLAARGYMSWQYVILHREYGQEDDYGKVEHDAFKTNMPKLFSDFDFDEFIELYEKVKMG